LELLSLPNTCPQLQNKSPAPRWSWKLVELQLRSEFRGAGALPNTPLIGGVPPIDAARVINREVF
jgi:hypothetical protein